MNETLLTPYNRWTKLKNNKEFTEIPSYSINKSAPEDNFFTGRKVANKYYNNFLKCMKNSGEKINNYYFIEPSVGDGCFYDLLPEENRIALDIKPKKSEFIKANYLLWYPSEKKKYIVIGNPPFGVRGALALAFIKRSLLFADYVAFILPMSFYTNGKGSNMSRVNNGHLIHNELLGRGSFYFSDTLKKVDVSTVFQIWKKGIKKNIFLDYDVSEYVDIFTVCSSPARLCGLDKLEKYSCYIASTFYKDIRIVYNFEDVKYGSDYGIIIKKDKDKIMKILQNSNWKNYSSKATNNCNHLRMHSIKKCLYDNKIGKKC